MELKRYSGILMAKWWIVLVTFLAAVGAALAFTINQTPMYESAATYVMKTNLSDPGFRDFASALTLMSRGQIPLTVAEVASSHMIKIQAAETLGLSSKQAQGMSVKSRSLAGTDVIQISVEGPDPALVRNLTSAVGAQTAKYVKGLYGMYDLQILDEPTLPSSPTSPRVGLNLLLGALAGLALGAGLAFLSSYLQDPFEKKVPNLESALAKRAGQAAKSQPLADARRASQVLGHYDLLEESAGALSNEEPVTHPRRRSPSKHRDLGPIVG